ncbi:MAG: 5'/3'-nucleotidase SurE [Treponema sp.]|jgi:5'-nucleotidase|nr:5'/3'-nucleotidase SurE [Treponema sp.]
MRILLTNDDGYLLPGITLLAKSLRLAGHKVFLVAPDKNRSGCSHSIFFLDKPIKLTQVEEDTWSCSGTPADCVIVALLGGIPEINISGAGTEINMEKAPDLVLSGINAGANLGTDITYSGTASAARQGSFFGIPSVALSLVGNEKPWEWETVVSYIVENLDAFMGYWKEETFVNINFPNNKTKPLALVPAFHSIRYYNDRIVTYTAPEGGVFCFAKPGNVENAPQEGSDWAEVLKNNAALSIVSSQPAAMTVENYS